MSNKKFFSGNSLRQALISAAAHFDVPADEIAYREVEKKHGFLKVRKRAVIEVDADDPRRPPAKPPAEPAAELPGDRLERGRATEAGAAELDSDPSHGRPPRLSRGADQESHWGGAGDRTKPARGKRPDEGDEEVGVAAVAPPPLEEDAEGSPMAASRAAGEESAPSTGRRRGRSASDEEEPPSGRRRRRVAAEEAVETHGEPDDEEEPEEAEDEGGEDDWDDEEEDRDDDLDRDEDEDRVEEDRPPRGARSARPAAAPQRATEEAEPEAGRPRRRRRRGGRGRGAGGGTERAPAASDTADDHVALPDRPRRPSERYAEARGPLADATREAVDRVLDVAGLDLSYTVLQGDDDRLEIDLSGRDEALLVTEGGELLRAIEHLVPRVVRGIAGEPVQVRVDSSDFHEIHEEQLRSLAQRVASEVRRGERPRTLEPMNPADRRIVHITLADEPGVTSVSEGSGYFKRIVVKPD